jgi:hypothetical protein
MNTEKLKQTIMLKKALTEEGIDPKACKIEIDHDTGHSHVNGVKLPIIFPRSFFNYAETVHKTNKQYMFYFNGNAGKGDTRKKLMQNFVDRKDSRMVFTNDGRVVENKGTPNPTYFYEMSQSHYGLCPHQPNWRGSMDALWTYRYIECLMLKTMPIQFRDTPLTESFTEKSIFKWDDDSFEKLPTQKELDFNYKFALKKFSLSKKRVKQIRYFASL